jgi:hypothetical protein
MKTVTEHQIQAAFFEHQVVMEKIDWRWGNIFANMNQGLRKGGQGAWAVAEGLKKGIPDITVALPAMMGAILHHGLYIELKRKGKKARAEQTAWHIKLRRAGYLVLVIDDYDILVQMVTKYIKHCTVI